MPSELVMINALSLAEAVPHWWRPPEPDTRRIVPGRAIVKVRLLAVDPVEGGNLFDSKPTWVAVERMTTDALEGEIIGGGLDVDGYREADHLVVPLDRVLDVVPLGDDDRPIFSEDRVRSLLGRQVLVGLTFLSAAGDILDRRQFVGTVDAYDATAGVRLTLPDGDTYVLPPDPRCLEEARPGEYRLRSTGEVISDPDFLSSWTITGPDDDDSPNGDEYPNGYAPGR